jgi:hypothetical protein
MIDVFKQLDHKIGICQNCHMSLTSGPQSSLFIAISFKKRLIYCFLIMCFAGPPLYSSVILPHHQGLLSEADRELSDLPYMDSSHAPGTGVHALSWLPGGLASLSTDISTRNGFEALIIQPRPESVSFAGDGLLSFDSPRNSADQFLLEIIQNQKRKESQEAIIPSEIEDSRAPVEVDVPGPEILWIFAMALPCLAHAYIVGRNNQRK